MPRFAANLSLLFAEKPFLERFQAAAEAGFRAVEFMFPYEYKKSDIATALKDNGLELVLHNLPPGNWARGERGVACHPDRVAEFRAGVEKAIDYAGTLSCPRLNCLAGIQPRDAAPERARAVLVENLVYAADKLAAANIGLLLEPVNSRAIPDFFVDRPSLGFSIVAEAGAKNLKVQYDIFHAQVMEGDLANTIEREFARIGHLQVADNPGRHEPGTGEINYPFLFEWIDRLGYAGWIGCEYNPKTTTAEGLGWLHSARAAAPAH